MGYDMEIWLLKAFDIFCLQFRLKNVFYLDDLDDALLNGVRSVTNANTYQHYVSQTICNSHSTDRVNDRYSSIENLKRI